MARNYLILLFSFAFFVGGGFMYWQVLKEKESRELIEDYRSDLEISVLTQREHISTLLDVGDANTFGYGYEYTYRSLIPILKSFREGIDKNNRSSCIKGDSFETSCSSIMIREFTGRLIDTIRTNHQELFLSKMDAKDIDSEIRQVYTSYLEKKDGLYDDLPEIRRLRYQLCYFTTMKNLVKIAVGLTGHMSTRVEMYYPVINMNKSLYRKGESGKCVIGIGAYTTAFEPEDVRIIVNGDTISIGPDGRARYTPPTDQRGEVQLNAQCIINNPVTGKVITGESTFTYEVR